MSVVAKVAMVLSFLYFAGGFATVWIGQSLGLSNDVWDMYDLPEQETPLALWISLTGFACSAFTMGMLFLVYRAAWKTLTGGASQDFRDLAKNLRIMGWGLIGFWFGFNLISGAMLYVVALGVTSTDELDLFYTPFDLDLVLAICGVVLLAISQTLQRAWLAEDENNHFL